ncbi:16S rRNA (uracil(1498)-N(3))-methyltransferase [Campylobacter sp.]|uniref:16S rRNA (uracil(1498)-N(3))-methyltransferase n=1 Tax=Campylobacter sp. TaxID=205 RepID=UPI00270452BA|nr:16S rRNA (uracil(1498)-N(3))-methyltransferase [Campylobacter sp.]
MKFLYSSEAKNEKIYLENEQFLHLKARRAKVGDRIDVRNLKDGQNYIYEIDEITRKSVGLSLVFAHSVESFESEFSIAWAVVDTKIIEKTLPFLNEMGVCKLIFFYADLSQRNFKIDTKRLERILIGSSEQCGRNSLMKIEIYKNLDELLKSYKNIALVDFGGEKLENYNGKELLVIGPEGGFSQNERERVLKKYGLSFKNILRAQTAILSVTAKILA